MWPEPDDHATVHRMRTAHADACSVLRTQPAPGGRETWGWNGRTLSTPVTTPDGSAWLRIAAAPIDQIVDTFWNGAIDAQHHLPPDIPRPQLQRWHDWSDHTWAYRAELYEHIAATTVADDAVITAPPTLPPGWWSQVRRALDTLATVNTTRTAIQPGFLAWAMPHHLRTSPRDHPDAPWTTAHGDFHFANLCTPRLHILDWEGWGTAPPGYDAASLHSFSLLVPDTAAQVRHELAHLLDTPAGRYAELVVITDLLHAATQGINPHLTEPLRRRATTILEQPG